MTGRELPPIKREDAQRFLKLLDDRTDRFTFQTLDDNKDRKNKALARILHGTLDQNYTELVNYSRAGAGIFVAINATNFQGRSKKCIVGVRAYFADLDGAPYENISRLGLKPHIITQTSPGRYGAFYKIADAPLSEEHFKQTQHRLAQLFESDPSVCDLPRVMRLPGFPHQKDPSNPFVTQIHECIEDASIVYFEAEFQQALTTALVAREPKKTLLDGAIAGLPKPPPDWSKGYAEGQRNNECARRAGSCLARGLSEEQTLAECLRWNKQNQPPLNEKEVRDCVRSIAKREAKKREGIALDSDVQQPSKSCRFVFDGEGNADPPKMLIKKLLPASGIAFIGGQSGAGKTFVAIALAVALAGGTAFFKYPVKERIGVAYIAAEGEAMFALRVAAAKLAADVKGRIPFAWSGSVPNLQTEEGPAAFIADLRALDQEMQKRFNVRLGAIFMDTVAACFVMQDENSNAEVSRVCNIMRQIGESVGTVIVPIHHYGKDPGTGLRGASAWRGAADVTISVTADINQLTGKASHRELALAKARDAEQGPIAPFILEWVRLGEDDDGEDFGSCIIKPDLEPRPAPARSKRRSKAATNFDNASQAALRVHGEFRRRGKDGAEFRVVELKHVKAEFRVLYGTGVKAGTIDKAWGRVLKKMPEGYFIKEDQDGREWLWPKN
jgi:hypothetical protein